MAKKGKKKRTLPAHAPEWTLLFLQTLSSTGNVTAACRAADVGRRTVYEHREKYPQFADAWDDSLEAALDKLEGVLWKVGADGNTRAIELVLKARRPIFREGHKSEVNVNNNTLVIEGQDPLDLLKSRMADMRERMIEGGVEVIAEALEPSDATDEART